MAVGIILSNRFEIGSVKKGTPDFNFTCGDKIINIEATAPQKGDCNNSANSIRVTTVSDMDIEGKPIIEVTGGDEDGIIYDSDKDKIRLRLTSAIDTKLKKNYKCDYLVFAINGYEALGNHSYLDGLLDPPYIIQVLFGIGNKNTNRVGVPLYQRNLTINKNIKENKLVPINANYFLPGNNTPINGVLYSNSSVNVVFGENWVDKLDSDWLYIQNPEKEDLTEIFTFCKIFHLKNISVFSL